MKIDITERMGAVNGKLANDGYFVEICECYDVKDALKGMGYKFNGNHKSWCKSVETEAEAVAEIANLFIAKLATPEDSRNLYRTGTLSRERNFTVDQMAAIRKAYGM